MKTLILTLQCLFIFSADARSLGEAQIDPYDSYGNTSWASEKAHLDNFALFLQRAPETIGYITVYAGRRSCLNEARNRGARAKNYVLTRGIQENRVKWLDGGYRDELTIILQPAPADAPTPSVFPTLKQSDVQILKGCKYIAPKTRKWSSRHVSKIYS